MRKTKIPGVILTLLFLAASVSFMAQLWGMKMLPWNYLAWLGAILVLLTLFLRWMMDSTKRHKVRFVIGVVLFALLVTAMGTGMFYLHRTRSTVDNISGVHTELSSVSIFVKTEDKDHFEANAKTYTYGILRDLDRENTNRAMVKFGEEMGSQPNFTEYDSPFDLANALFAGEVQAIILNGAYLPILEEVEGFGDIRSRLCEVAITHVEAPATEPPKQSGSPEDPSGSPQDPTEPESANVFTLYISGIDTFGKLATTSRSDVNIIAAINVDTHQILLVSTPRDYFVPHPKSNGKCDKLTNAGVYGINVSMGALETLYDVDLNYYFRVNFTGFKEIIDALGGVTVENAQSFTVDGYDYAKGSITLNGEHALALARERHSFAGGDRQRGKNQMAVIQGVLNKLLSKEMLMNYLDVLDAVEGSFETSLPYDKISELVRLQLAEGGDWNVVSYSVNGFDDSQKPYSQGSNAYVMQPDWATVETAKDLFAQLYRGEVPTLPDAE